MIKENFPEIVTHKIVHRDPIRKLSRAKNEVGRVAIESFNKKFNQKVQFNKIQNKELKSKLKLMSLNKNAKNQIGNIK